LNITLMIQFIRQEEKTLMVLKTQVEKLYFKTSGMMRYTKLTRLKNLIIDLWVGSNMKKIYLASGWFNPTQAEELTRLEEICDSRAWIDLASPRRIFVCPPNAPKETQDATFDGNLHHIKTADFLIVNTRDKDIGTIWEAGYAYANEVPIVYFCQGLPQGAKFNLMLARSGVKVCTSFDQLENYLDRCFELGQLINEPYDQEIE